MIHNIKVKEYTLPWRHLFTCSECSDFQQMSFYAFVLLVHWGIQAMVKYVEVLVSYKRIWFWRFPQCGKMGLGVSGNVRFCKRPFCQCRSSPWTSLSDILRGENDQTPINQLNWRLHYLCQENGKPRELFIVL